MGASPGIPGVYRAMNVKFRRMIAPSLFLLPGMLIIAVVIFYPFVRNLMYSFTDFSILRRDAGYVGFENYADILAEGVFANSLKATLVWSFANMFLLILFGVTMAFLLRAKLFGSSILYFLLLIPWIMPEVVTGYTWKFLLNYQSGIYYNLLKTFGLIPGDIDIFASKTGAMLAVVFANVWRSFPIIALTTYAKLKTLSADLVESAMIDGARRWHVFFYLELPHIASTLLSVSFLCFVWTYNAFGIIYVMTGGGPLKTTEILAVLLQKIAFDQFNFSKASAMSVLAILVLVCIVATIYLLLKQAAKRGMRNA